MPYLRLPLPVERVQEGQPVRFTSTILDRTYEFLFRYNAYADHWVLEVRNQKDEKVMRTKIVYGSVYNIEEFLVLAFFDPQHNVREVTKETLGDPVIGGVGLLAG